MSVISSVVRRAGARKHLVIDRIVAIHIVTGGSVDDERIVAEIADHRSHGNVDDIVTESPAIGPPTGDGAGGKTGESRLNLAGEKESQDDLHGQFTGVTAHV